MFFERVGSWRPGRVIYCLAVTAIAIYHLGWWVLLYLVLFDIDVDREQFSDLAKIWEGTR